MPRLPSARADVTQPPVEQYVVHCEGTLFSAGCPWRRSETIRGGTPRAARAQLDARGWFIHGFGRRSWWVCADCNLRWIDRGADRYDIDERYLDSELPVAWARPVLP